MRTYLTLVQESYDRVIPNEGVSEALEFARGRGWHCAVVTSNSEALAQNWLKKNEIDQFVFCVVGKESVHRGKPDPEPYNVALSKMGCAAEMSLAVEDSPSGVLSATAAHIRTFAYAPLPSSQVFPENVKLLKTWLELKDWL